MWLQLGKLILTLTHSHTVALPQWCNSQRNRCRLQMLIKATEIYDWTAVTPPLCLPPTAGAGLQLHDHKVQRDGDGGGRSEAVFSLHLPGKNMEFKNTAMINYNKKREKLQQKHFTQDCLRVLSKICVWGAFIYLNTWCYSHCGCFPLQVRARTSAGYGAFSRRFEFQTSPYCEYTRVREREREFS